jgi:hypothetical protein
MSCDTPTDHTAFDLDPCLSPRLELGDFAPTGDLARDKSLKQGGQDELAINLGQKYTSFRTAQKQCLSTSGVTKDRSMTEQFLMTAPNAPNREGAQTGIVPV